MKKTGFTLVELLAVMVILAIILAIAVPSISGIISGSTRGAFESDAKMVLQQLEYKKIEDDSLDETTITESNIKALLGISNSNYEVLQVSIVSGKPYILILGKNKWDGYKACGTITNMKVVDASDEEECKITPLYVGYNADEGVNAPRLAEGMTAIKWDGNDWVKVDDPDNDTSWYDYANQEWANAVTGDCATPGDYDTCSMWVWIPRYAYQITKCYHQDNETCTNPITSNSAGEIDVKFLIDGTNTTSDSTTIYKDNASNIHHILHPAFTFGDKELTGIWVAKFEASAPTSSTCYQTPNYTNCNKNDIPLRFVPNVSSRTSTAISNIFASSRLMEKNVDYGWTTIPSEATLGSDGIFSTESGGNPNYNNIDTHMMKNIEWGEVAYLSQSQYGKYGNNIYTGINKEIYLNYSDEFITGSSNGTPGGLEFDLCPYNDITNRGSGTGSCGGGASTTGNIYGIYDMSGGLNEYVMGNYNNEGSFSGLTPSNIHDKYIDRYTAYNNTKYGDAIFEISGSSSAETAWYGNTSLMIETEYSWFRRGGEYGSSGVGAFFFDCDTGGAYDYNGFRSVLVVHPGI